jgi:hypothetical protein
MPELEFVTLANHAEAIDGLLYLSGAGWTDHSRPQPSEDVQVSSHFGIGASILVHWTETNQPHQLTIKLESEDGDTLLDMSGNIEVPRPLGIPAGSDQRAVLAVNADIHFENSGGYRIVAQLGEQTKTVSFRVHDIPPPSLMNE